MALSPVAARALEQVKMGLSILYGAEYFTEEEWIKIDGLIHKGKYVFTNGPQQNLVDDQLIDFDDHTDSDDTHSLDVQAKGKSSITEVYHILEAALPSPPMSDPAESDFPAETPNTTSAEVSSEEDNSPATTAGNNSDKASLPAETTPTPTRAPPKLHQNGGLPPGITQAQLDEVKAFHSGLKKVGEKPSRGTRHVSGPQSSRSQPTRDTNSHIESWASKVDAQENASIPTPAIRAPVAVKAVEGNTLLTRAFLAAASPEIKQQYEAFRRIYGRDPRVFSDIMQPNNPGFRPLTARPNSQMSRRSTRSTITTTTSRNVPTTPIRGAARTLHVKPDTILTAQRSCEKTSQVRLAIQAGDQIKYSSHVSSTCHSGTNMRTKLKGHFDEVVLKPADPAAMKQQQRAVFNSPPKASPGVIGDRRRISLDVASTGLEMLETSNAAEWNEDASAVVSSATTNKAGGLGTSRFANADLSSGNEMTSSPTMDQIIEQKVAQALAAQAFPAIPAARPFQSPPTRPSTAAIRPPWQRPKKEAIGSEPIPKVQPKTATCWWWATPGKDCRFTAEECRDLHGFLPGPDSQANLRMGRPTWGAAADYVTPPATDLGGSVEDLGPANTGVHKSKTCWYWANDAKGCANSATDCKYLHEKCSGGVANKPNSWKRNDWSRWNENDKENGESIGDGGDETVDGGEDQGNIIGWETEIENGVMGYSGWGNEDAIRPAHILALEQKALAETVGW